MSKITLAILIAVVLLQLPLSAANAKIEFSYDSESGKITTNSGVIAYSLGEYKKAVSLLTLDANKGDAMAQYYLGVSYAEGKGVVADQVQAYLWLSLAASNARDPRATPKLRSTASKTRDVVASKMNSAKINEAMKLISAWKPAPEPNN